MIENDEEILIQKYMNEALKEAEISLSNGETPVGCVFVYNNKVNNKSSINGTDNHDNNSNNNNVITSSKFSSRISTKIIARGSNQTNITRNGTRHAEMVAIDDIILNQKLPLNIFVSKDVFSYSFLIFN